LNVSTVADDDDVHRGVDHNHDGAEDPLQLARQRGGIEDRQQILLDETGGIPGAAAAPPQPVLERRQRADPAGELDPGAPDRRRHVQPGDPGAPEHQQPAEDDEEHEREVDGDRRVGQNLKDHMASEALSRTPKMWLRLASHSISGPRSARASRLDGSRT
jgi:hypothetical protein